jgi:hypothetical protein
MTNTAVNPLDMKLITDITGRHYSIRDLMKAPRISLATEKQGRTGEKLHRMGTAFVLSQETLTRFDAKDLPHLIEKLKDVTLQDFPEVMSFDKLAENFSENYTILVEDVMTREEWLAFVTVKDFHSKFHAWYSSAEKSGGMRELAVGDSNVATAWTDGESYIAIGIGLLRKAVRRGAVGFMDLLSTLTHEYVHDSSDLESHDHDLGFYNKYHDLMEYGGTGKLLSLSLEMEKAYNKALIKAGLAEPTVKAVPKPAAKRTVAKAPRAQNQQSYNQVPQQASFAM